MGWLGWFLASHGYIAAGVNHHGTPPPSPDAPQGFILEWERPRDIFALIDKILADSKFGPRIDPTRIAAAHRQAHPEDINCNLPPTFRQWIDRFKDQGHQFRHSGLPAPPDDPHRDPRVKAVFAMAPAVGFAFTEASLRSIQIPVYIIVGADDTIVDPKTNAERYAKLISGAQLKIFLGSANHYIFGTLCNPSGEKVLDSCKPDPGINRAQIHIDTERIALDFIQKSLKLK